MDSTTPACHHFWLIGLAFLVGVITGSPAYAQVGLGGGLPIYITGMVQVEPGSDVMILQVKEDKIRFAIRDVRGSTRNFPAARFISDVTRSDPGLYIKGPEQWMDMLLNERPSKRVLRMTGMFYPESRFFMISNIEQVRGGQISAP